jgi:hypothetical protein
MKVDNNRAISSLVRWLAPNQASARTRALRYSLVLAGVLVLILGVSSISHEQSGSPLLVVISNNRVFDGDTISIDATPSMPPLTLSVAGTCADSCSVHYTFQVDFTAPGGQQTFSSTTGDFSCDSSGSIDWTTIGFRGGTATISWLVNNGNDGGGTFTFTIKGTNPSAAQVDSLASSPWFFENIISQESSYLQFISNGTPYIGNNPNGIGLTQLDPPPSSDDFWNWRTNMTDGAALLGTKQPIAYNSWSNEFQQMVNTTSGNPVFPPATAYTFCLFQYPQNGADSYADGDWIHYYNSNFFIFWNPTFRTWDIDTNGYVKAVCNAAPR